MKIYTRTGDDGSTALFGGRRVAKTHPRVEAYGTIDELSSVMGLAASLSSDSAVVVRITSVQERLLDLGADLATPPDERAARHLARASSSWVSDLEADIDAMSAELPPLSSFVLPGGSRAGAALHVARAVCRRAERRIIEASASGEELASPSVAYVNRLSDWLFTLARWANHREGTPEHVPGSAGEGE